MKKYLLTIMMGLTIFFAPIIAGNIAFANSSQEACKGIELVGGKCDEADPKSNVDNLLNNVIDILSALVGTVCVIMIMIGGFTYITSGGDANKVSKGKDTILYAIIGLVVVIFAQVIVKFVINKL